MESPEAVAIVRAMTQMGPEPRHVDDGRRGGDRGQLDIVRAEGCTEVQGYLFSAAKPAHEIAKLLLNPAAA